MLAVLVLLCGMTAAAQKNPYVGNVMMPQKHTLLENLTASPIHKRLLSAIEAAGLADTLGGSGHVTLFAPTDDAFAKLPAGTLTRLELPENKEQLRRLVQYHLVAGKLTAKKLAKLVKKGKGTAVLQTMAGTPLTVKRVGTILTLTDAKGAIAVIITADVTCKDDILHVIDAVLMPE